MHSSNMALLKAGTVSLNSQTRLMHALGYSATERLLARPK
jgi:hypothetical protein